MLDSDYPSRVTIYESLLAAFKTRRQRCFAVEIGKVVLSQADPNTDKHPITSKVSAC